MTETQRAPGGFAGDPGAALPVAGTGGCCGNPPVAAIDLPEPATGTAPCCGTPAEAAAAGGCCGTAAKAEAVASGAGCCG
jgi:hypothetical protein